MERSEAESCKREGGLPFGAFGSPGHYLPSEQVHPVRLTAIGTSDEVDPMQSSQSMVDAQ